MHHATAVRVTRARWRPRPLVIAVTALLVAVAGIATGEIGAQRAAAASDDAPLVFILDASGSMVREVSTGVTRMDVAKDAMAETIESLSDDAEVGVLVFGTGTGNTDAERAAGCSDVTTLVPVGPVDADEVSRVVGGVAASGFTPISTALRKAAAMLPSASTGHIVLISDGVDTCSPPSSCQVAAELHRANPLLSIDVVAFGVDDDEEAQQQMTCIGGVGGGVAVAATDPDQLVRRLKAASVADSSTVLSARGLHDVALGMTLDEVRAAVDGAKVGPERTVDGVTIVIVDCGWGTVELHDNRVVQVTPDDEATATAEGISPGDALSDAERVYGAPVDTDSAASAKVYQTQPGSSTGYRVTYDAATKKIRYIVLCRCVPASAVSGAMSEWEITFDGVGPLALGMTSAEARAAVPELVTGRTADYMELGSTGPSANDVPLIELTFVEDRLVSIRVGSTWADAMPGAALPHARGIRLGESAATVENAFPGGSYRSFLVQGTSEYLVSDRTGRLLTFAVAGSSLFSGHGTEEGVESSPLGSITLEDAAVLLTQAARDYLYGG